MLSSTHSFHKVNWPLQFSIRFSCFPCLSMSGYVFALFLSVEKMSAYLMELLRVCNWLSLWTVEPQFTSSSSVGYYFAFRSWYRHTWSTCFFSWRGKMMASMVIKFLGWTWLSLDLTSDSCMPPLSSEYQQSYLSPTVSTFLFDILFFIIFLLFSIFYSFLSLYFLMLSIYKERYSKKF